MKKLKNPLAVLFAPNRREQYLARYVIREAGRGRSLQQILDDPYVVNRSTPEERARLLDSPEVVEAIGESAVAELRRGISVEFSSPASPGRSRNDKPLTQ
jgi:hypothetical protein